MILEASGLRYVYMAGTPYESVALQDVSLSVAEGESVAILGRTGCGKSTLVQHFNGLLRPTGGAMRVLGKDTADPRTDLRELRFQVGLVFQFPETQLFEETVRADIGFGPRMMKLSRETVEARVDRAAALVGLDMAALGERSPFALSGGEQRRVAIAGVLAMEPKVLVLDEPTAGLDAEGRDELVASLKQLGCTLILVSHDLDVVAALTPRVVVLEAGRKVWDGSLRDALQQNLPGLSATAPGRLCARLADEGVPVRRDVVTAAEAAEALAELM